MQISSRFVVDQFQLELNPSAYLVEVSPVKGNHRVKELSELPSWVFNSKHAIWLTSGTKPLIDRAIEGERIKEILRGKLPIKFARNKKQSTFLLPGAMRLIGSHSNS